jgi:8-oxo-dGTP pyrophosphatase MutT (NUDIX family)
MSRRSSLLVQLASYTPVDALESRHHAAIVRLLAHGLEVFSRASFAPGHVTASCFIIDDAGDRLLLHHHRALNRWLQMGGHVECDETPIAASLREGREESGLPDLVLAFDGVFDLDVHSIPARKSEPDHHHFDVRFLARTSSPDAISIDPSESNDLAWVPLPRAVEMMNEEASTRVIRKIERFVRDRRSM